MLKGRTIVSCEILECSYNNKRGICNKDIIHINEDGCQIKKLAKIKQQSTNKNESYITTEEGREKYSGKEYSNIKHNSMENVNGTVIIRKDPSITIKDIITKY